MDALNLPSATLIGHSMGGVIIGYAALAAPSRLDKLVMIEPGFYTNKTPAFLQYMYFPLNRIMARQFYTRSMTERFLLASFYDKSMVTGRGDRCLYDSHPNPRCAGCHGT